MATTSPLRQRMIEDMTIRNLLPATQQSYFYAVPKFSRNFKLSLDKLGMEDVRAYQLHLVEEKQSWSHIKKVICALRFSYGITLGQKEVFERIVFGKEPAKLPPVFNAEPRVKSESRHPTTADRHRIWRRLSCRKQATGRAAAA
jgi:integrase/recombinase XerD